MGVALWKWALLPLIMGVICMAYLWAGNLQNFMSPETARIIFWHVPMAMVSLVWFAASAWYSVRYLRRGQPFDDDRAAIAAEIGLMTTVLATLTGAIFSKMQWAGGLNSKWYEGYWQWDPKQTAILVVILIFGAYFGLRMSVEDTERRARLSAVYSVLGALTVPLLYWVLPHLPIFASLHPTDTIKQGMDTPYRVTFWTSTLFFTGITLWAYQLKLRVAELSLRRMLSGAATGAGSAPTVAVRRPRPEVATHRAAVKEQAAIQQGER